METEPSPAPDGERTDVADLLGDTLWAARFPYKEPRVLPRVRRRLDRGLWRAARWVGDVLFERGLETTGVAAEVDHFHPDRVWYQPSGWTYLSRILRPRDVAATDVFVDFGAGKGRVVCQAARYPFARVIGVEIVPALCAAARRNIERRGATFRCGEVEIVEADAAAYQVPDDVTVAYFYYPFVGDTFRRVLENIGASLDRAPRRLRIVYALPTMEDAILETGRFRRVKQVRILDSGLRHRIAVYESV